MKTEAWCMCSRPWDCVQPRPCGFLLQSLKKKMSELTKLYSLCSASQLSSWKCEAADDLASVSTWCFIFFQSWTARFSYLITLGSYKVLEGYEQTMFGSDNGTHIEWCYCTGCHSWLDSNDDKIIREPSSPMSELMNFGHPYLRNSASIKIKPFRWFYNCENRAGAAFTVQSVLSCRSSSSEMPDN